MNETFSDDIQKMPVSQQLLCVAEMRIQHIAIIGNHNLFPSHYHPHPDYPRLQSTWFYVSFLGSLIFWGFDNSMQDLYNLYNTVGSNGPTFSSPGYNGAGACLLLSSSSSQSASVASPFLNMASKSFTLEAWIYANSLNNPSDSAIFGQYDSGTTDHALHINIRNHRIYFGLFGDDLSGITVGTDGEVTLLLW